MTKRKLREDALLMVKADTVDELQRLLQLAGLGAEEASCGCGEDPNAASPQLVHLQMAQTPQTPQVAFESADIDEGWLDKEAPPGVERFKVGKPEDMVDLDFSGDDLSDPQEDVEEEAGDPGEFDHGHDHMMVRRYDSPALGRNENGRAPVRYTPARHGDNPLMDADDELADDEDRDELDKEINNVVKRMPQGQRDSYIDREARRVASRLGRKPDDVSQEIKDQIVLGSDVRESLEESITVIVEDDSNELLTALRKLRHRLYEQLTPQETSHLAAAFINMMRDDNAGRVAQLHQMFQNYIGETDMNSAYSHYRRTLR